MSIASGRPAVAAFAFVALVACGGGGGSGSSSGSDGTPPGSPPPPAQANSPPEISGAPATAIAPGKPYEFAPRASDADGDALEFSVRNLPGWAHFDTTTGRLSGVPGPDDMGTYSSITISVSDGESTTTFPAFSIVVERAGAGSGSADLKWHAPKENEDGSKIKDLAGFRVYYGQRSSSLDYRVEIPSPHIKKASIEELRPGTWYFAVTAYTERGAESALSEIVSKTID